MQLVSTNLPTVVPRLLPIIPALRERTYMLCDKRSTCEEVFYVEWGMPYTSELQVVSRLEDLHCLDGRGLVLWEAFGAYRVPNYNEVRWAATATRGFEIKPTTEFVTWLKKHMQGLAQVQVKDGLRVLVQSLLKQQ